MRHSAKRRSQEYVYSNGGIPFTCTRLHDPTAATHALSLECATTVTLPTSRRTRTMRKGLQAKRKRHAQEGGHHEVDREDGE